MSYEQDLARIEQIVAELERKDIDLGAAMTLFEEGVGLLRRAADQLAGAEEKVRRLVEDADGKLRLADFDG